MINYIEYILLIVMSGFLNLFPVRFVQKFGHILGGVFFYLIPIRKKVAYINLSLCFPEKDKKWKSLVIKKSYQNVVTTLFEILIMPKIQRNGFENIIENVNKDSLEVRNKGIILVSGHYSNWELSAIGIAYYLKHSINVIVKTQTNKLVDKRINQYRVMTGNKMLPTGISLRAMPGLLKNNEIIAFLIDQSAPEGYSYFVDFFGKKVSSFSGPAKYALKYDSNIVFGYIIRNEKGKFNIETFNIDKDNLKGTMEEQAEELTARIQKTMENIIRKSPEQWLWFDSSF